MTCVSVVCQRDDKFGVTFESPPINQFGRPTDAHERQSTIQLACVALNRRLVAVFTCDCDATQTWFQQQVAVKYGLRQLYTSKRGEVSVSATSLANNFDQCAMCGRFVGGPRFVLTRRQTSHQFCLNSWFMKWLIDSGRAAGRGGSSWLNLCHYGSI